MEKRSEQSARILVREMTPVAGDPLLDVKRVGTVEQQVGIIIRFKDEEITFFHRIQRGGQTTEVGHHADFMPVGLDRITDRIGGIVRNRKGMDLERTDPEGRAGFKQMNRHRELPQALGGPAGFFIGVDRDIVLQGERTGPVKMIVMFMGNEDRLDLADIDLNGAKAGDDLPCGKTGIDQDPFSLFLPVAGVADVGGISPASAPQQTDP